MQCAACAEGGFCLAWGHSAFLFARAVSAPVVSSFPASVAAFLASAAAPAATGAWEELRQGVLETAELLKVHWQGEYKPRMKLDGTPVSEADDAANASLLALLARLTPEIPVVSEESPLPEGDWSAPVFWLLDPLDGTRAFLRREREFVISLGLVVHGVPVAGVIAAPVWREKPTLGWGRVGEGAWMLDMEGKPQPLQARNIAVQQLQRSGLDLIVAYRGATPKVDEYFSAMHEHSRIPCSSALKFLLLSQGMGDCYPRFASLQQWDTAGGDALLRAAGGEVRDLEGALLTYGLHPERGWQNPPFLASGAHGFASYALLRGDKDHA